MKSLRSGLARECKVLVKSERANLVSKDVSKNVLIKAEVPTKEDLEEFFRTIVGMKGSSVTIDIKASAFVEAFKAVVGAASAANKVATADKAFLGLCVAIASSPDIIIY
ncbi:MAG: hypothetical protein EOP09_15205 [Proteobacteria bacterium]|nr:MAG: hypothetical protein EOP09_15205 [Pseudomonadota bacterium]